MEKRKAPPGATALGRADPARQRAERRIPVVEEKEREEKKKERKKERGRMERERERDINRKRKGRWGLDGLPLGYGSDAGDLTLGCGGLGSKEGRVMKEMVCVWV